MRCNRLQPLYGALPGRYVSVRVTQGALVAHEYIYVLPSCRTTLCRETLIPVPVSLWNNLGDPVFDAVGLAGFKIRANDFLLA